MFPLLVRSIGVVASIISTYQVKASDRGSVGEAMKSINSGFWTGSALSVIGFMVLGFFYLRFDASMVGGHALPQQAWKASVTWATGRIWASVDSTFARPTPAGWRSALSRLNRTTEYFTGTEYRPVKGLVRNCTTGHPPT